MDVTIWKSGDWWTREELNVPLGGPIFETLDECANASVRFERIHVRIFPGFPLARWWKEQER